MIAEGRSATFRGGELARVWPSLVCLALAALFAKPAAGRYTLEITNASGTLSGTLNRWSLTLLRPVSGTGTGEAVADRTQAQFRIFSMSPTDHLGLDQRARVMVQIKAGKWTLVQ